MIILGIDPGLATTGYGVIRHEAGALCHIASGVILTKSSACTEGRLLCIYSELNRLIESYSPDVLVTEQLFFGNNATTALQVGKAIGVALLVAAQTGLDWVEYRPNEVKLAVTGYGAAEKRQVQQMVTRLLALSQVPKPDDAADALAIAICHAHSLRQNQL
jgi:crossover junction endodeoxyribonuclease RuvC